MERSKQFGKTWWGNLWIEAIERIDYNTNRLSRGKSYARGDKASSIDIDSHGKVTAKVKGSRPRPYKVEISLKSFNSLEKAAIKAIISNDPTLAAELSMGRLPENMLQYLEKRSISIFPKSWNDIDAHCSCPDWASPCKHMAAIYYTIANEIDKNPLILFKLRNLDLSHILEQTDFKKINESGNGTALENGIGNTSRFIHYSNIKTASKESLINPDNEDNFTLGSKRRPFVDLSGLADKKECESVFALLSDNPLFYTTGNFKNILLKAYRNISESIDKIEIKENGYNFKNAVFTLICPSLAELSHTSPRKKSVKSFEEQSSFFITPHPSVSGKRSFLSSFEMFGSSKGKMLSIPQIEADDLVLIKKRGLLIPAGSVLDIFLALPFGLSVGHTSQCADFLNSVVSLARALAGSSSFAPVVQSFANNADDGKSFHIVYKPLYRSEKLQETIDYLTSIMPQGFVFCPKEEGVAENSKAIDELLTLILTYIVKKYSNIKSNESDKLAKAFFSGEPFHVERFEEQQTAKAISNWLGWLNLKPVSIAPVIEIGLPEADSEKFTLRVKVIDRKSPLSSAVLLREVFDGKKDELFSVPIELVRREISRQLTIAGEHVPILKALLSYKGKKHANLSSETLVEFLTKGRGICSLLGIKAILPKSLLNMATPRVALSAKAKSDKVKSVSYLNLNDMLDFSWQISIGDVSVSAEEFGKIAESAAGVVKFRDQYLFVEPNYINALLKRLKEPVPRLSPMETLKAAVTGEISDIVFNPDLMLKQMIDALSASKDVSLPSDLRATLRPYQQRGFSWLYNNTIRGLGSCLADDMGLGKTVQVLALLLKLKEEKWSQKKALVVCPTTLIGNWIKECEKFAPAIEVSIYHGTSRDLEGQADLIITSYGMLRRDIAIFKKIKWSTIIIDEAQNIKNSDTDRQKL